MVFDPVHLSSSNLYIWRRRRIGVERDYAAVIGEKIKLPCCSNHHGDCVGYLAYSALVRKWIFSTKYVIYFLFNIGRHTELLAGSNLQKTECVFACSVFHGLTNTLLSVFVIKVNVLLVIGLLALLVYSIYLWYRGEATQWISVYCVVCHWVSLSIFNTNRTVFPEKRGSVPTEIILLLYALPKYTERGAIWNALEINNDFHKKRNVLLQCNTW